MKQFKKLLTFAILVFATAICVAQTENKDVTITASGSGATQEVAKQSALRSAIEQAYGTFISSKTEMLNDQVVADEMASVSAGNIKSYEILNEAQRPDGRWGVTLKATVSVDKLTSFVEAKGIAIEVKGGMFALNIKQQILNEQGEINAIMDMIGLIHEPMQTAFDYTLKSSEPKSVDAESKNWEIPLEVTATCNKNIDFCANYLIKTLRSISLTASEVETYKSLNKEIFSVGVDYEGKTEVFYLRKLMSVIAIKSFASNWNFYVKLFLVQSGLDELVVPINASIHSYNFIEKDQYQYNSYSEFNPGVIKLAFLSEGQSAGIYKWMDKRTLTQIELIKGYIVKPIGVVSQIKYGGYVVQMPVEATFKVGIGLDSVNIVNELVPQGAAYEAGIQKGDKILYVNGETIRSIEQIREAIKTGNTISIKLQRQSKTKEIKVKPKYVEPTKGLVLAICDIAGRGTGSAMLDLADAQKACDELSINGYSDWYLPSVTEMTAICNNIHLRGLGGFIAIDGGGSAGYKTTTVCEGWGGRATFTYMFKSCRATDTYGVTDPLYVRAVRAFDK